jgi:hypothetical protein
MDGLNLKFSGDILEKAFKVDEFGSLIPNPNYLNLQDVANRVERQLSADTGLARRLTEQYYKTDVEFTDNPHGNTPVLGAGVKLFGPRPLKGMKFGGRLERITNSTTEATRTIKKRQEKIIKHHDDLVSLHKTLEPADKDSAEYLLWLIEGDQAMTGGGFDGNAIGEVNKSALNFVIKSNSKLDFEGTRLSQLVVEGALWLKEQLIKAGMKPGSLKPDGASVVRFDQDTDGMIGWPLFAKGNAPLTNELATRLLIETGVSTVEFVDSTTIDRNNGLTYKYRNIDALSYILDRLIVSPGDYPSVVTLLARIQKHGWKMEDGKTVAKPGKTRSIYPNAAIPSMIEAMIMSPFMRAIQRFKVPFMPSLQDKPTRVEIITNLIKEADLKGYDFLAADWSKYDATVKGAILATIINIAVKPFFNSNYYKWVDFANTALCFKYLLTSTSLAAIWPEFTDAKQSSDGGYRSVGPFTIFGLTDGLISGAKFTHGGGSMYGEVVIHYVIPKLLGYDPLPGPQAGDDTLVAIPKNLIDLTSAEATYSQIADIADQIGLEMNAAKQIWHHVKGEVVKVFLQESYHLAANVWGVGSIFRPADALFFMERDKGLTISEQLMAEIARMNQGYDNPFAKEVIKYWFEREQFLGILFKEKGISGLDFLIKTIGESIDTIAQRIDVGSFTWGVGLEQLQSGQLPILPLMAEVAAEMSFNVDASKVLKSLVSEEPEEILGPESDSSTPEDGVVLGD